MPTYYSGLIPDFWRRYEQRRAVTGRSLTPGELAELSSQLGDVEYQKAQAAEERAQRQAEAERRDELLRQQIQDQKRAATISGIAQLGGLGANLYLANKTLGLLGSGGATTAGGAATRAAGGLLPTLGGGGQLALPALAPPGALSAAGLAPWAGGAAGGGVFTGGAAAGGKLAAAGVAPVLEAPTTFGSAAVLETAGAAPAAAAAGPSLTGALLPGALGGALGYGASRLLHANKDITQGLSYAGAGAGIGMAVGGPVGALIGGAIGAVVSFLDDIF